MAMQDVFTFFMDLLVTLGKLVFFCIFASVKNIVPSVLWPKKSVKGEIVLITGAGGGIGRQIAIQFARLGSKLVLWDYDNVRNEETADILHKMGAEAYTYACDVSKREEIYQVAKRVRSEIGAVTILINNAGIVSGKYFHDLPDESIIKTMEVNVMAHFWTLKAFLPDMVRNDKGHIVTIASVTSDLSLGGASDYCTSKAAAKHLHDALIREMHIKKSKIQFTVVCPFTVASGMFDGIRTKYEVLLTPLTPEFVGKKVALAVQTELDTLYLPSYLMQLMVFLKHVLPLRAQLAIEDFFDINNAMRTFVGHRGQTSSSPERKMR